MTKAVQCPKCGKWVLADEQGNPVPHINPGGSICQIADYIIGNGDADWIKQVRNKKMITPKSFDDFPAAFDYCREADKPITVMVRGEKYKLYPSGHIKKLSAKQVRDARFQNKVR